MAERTSDPLQNLKQRTDRRAAFLLELQEIKENDPDFWAELVCAFAESSVGAKEPGKISPEGSGCSDSNGDEGSTARERVVSFFRMRNNAWCGTAEIAKSIGLTAGGLGNVLYRQDTPLESKPHPTHGKKRLWRLKADGE